MVLADVNRLVDLERGLISPRIFSDESIYQEELQQIFARCWLFLCHGDADPEPRRLPQHLHGRGPGPGHPRPGGQGQCLPEHLSAPGQPPLPRRRWQRRSFHLCVSRLGLRSGRQAAGRAQLAGCVLQRAGPVEVGADPGGAAGQLQGPDLRHLRRDGAAATGLSRPDDLVPGTRSSTAGRAGPKSWAESTSGSFPATGRCQRRTSSAMLIMSSGRICRPSAPDSAWASQPSPR